MGLTLQDGVFQTRDMLGEQNPNYWNTPTIIKHLNWAAQDMCSAAQNLETAIQFNWPNAPGGSIPIEEAFLQPTVDQILSVAILSGQLFQLQQMEATDIKVASRVGNIPEGFYTYTSTQVLTPQGIVGTGQPNSGGISLIPQNPLNPGGSEYTTVMGLWPVPSANYPTTIWYTQRHPWVQNPKDPIGIDARFIRGWVAYAVARCKEKESALDEATYYQTIYDKAREELIEYGILRKQLRTFPQYGGTAWPSLARGSSSIIFIDQNPGVVGM